MRFLVLLSLWLVSVSAWSAIYTWVDAKGETHFSDRPPPGQSAKHYQGSNPDTFTSFRSHQSQVSQKVPGMTADERRQVTAAIDAVMHKLNQDLHLNVTNHRALEVHLFADRSAYLEKVMSLDKDFYHTQGLYVLADRTIYTYRQGNWGRTLAVIKHEVVHAILHQNIDQLPTWIHEGLAMTLAGEAKSFGNHEFLPLDEFLAKHGPQWHLLGRSHGLMHRQSASLMRFLMSHSEGKQLLSNLVWKAKRGEQDSLTLIERHYFGGVSRLSTQWRAWLASSK